MIHYFKKGDNLMNRVQVTSFITAIGICIISSSAFSQSIEEYLTHHALHKYAQATDSPVLSKIKSGQINKIEYKLLEIPSECDNPDVVIQTKSNLTKTDLGSIILSCGDKAQVYRIVLQ